MDAVTGEGLSLSFRQAMALADALSMGNLESYQESHCRLFRRPRLMGNLLLVLDRRTGLRKRTLLVPSGCSASVRASPIAWDNCGRCSLPHPELFLARNFLKA